MEFIENIFCSIPMYGKSLEEVEKDHELLVQKAMPKIKETVEDKLLEGLTVSRSYKVIDNIHKDNVPENAGRIWYLGDSIKLMENATFVVFGKGWENSKGCTVEMEVCKQYGKAFIIEGVDF